LTFFLAPDFFSALLLPALSAQLSDLWFSLRQLLPEICLAAGFILLLLLDLFLPEKIKKNTLSVVLTLIFLATAVLVLLPQVAHQSLFLGMLQHDGSAVFFKLLFLLSGIFTLLMLRLSRQADKYPGEFFASLCAVVLGLHLLVMSVNLMGLYVSVELVSVGSYLLAALPRTARTSESAIRYLLLGALSSGIMLYGISLLYGFTGRLYFSTPDFPDTLSRLPVLPVQVALLMVFGGIFFKIAAFPFHLWLPDVYETAPLPVVAFLSVAPKAAGFVVLYRLAAVYPLPAGFWAAVILLTLAAGNFSALWQQNPRRLLAYSSVAHTGFMLMGLAAGSELGWQSVVFYWATYLFMNFGAFLLVALLASETPDVQDFRGLGLRNPMAGVGFLVMLVGLAGLPPTSGFSAKLLIFSSVWEWYEKQHNPAVLLIFTAGLANVAVSLFYYLKIPYQLFFKPADTSQKKELNLRQKIFLGLLLIPVLLFFFKTDWLMNWIAGFLE
jgi:NADH-quinone oxidoreductase subunit N